MGSVSLVYLHIRHLYLLACTPTFVLYLLLGGGDLVRPLSFSWEGGGFNTPSQVTRYLVLGVLVEFGYRE